MLAVVLATLVVTLPGPVPANGSGGGLRRAGPEAFAGKHSPPNRAEPWSFPPPKDTDR